VPGEDEAPKPANINETCVDTIVGDLRISVHRDVLAGTTIDLTLNFQKAGRIVTAAYVQPKSANIVEPVRRCAARSPRP
jgi:hypothetical protein